MPDYDHTSTSHLPFAIAMRGYDRDQVAEFFARSDAEMRVIAADRDAAAANARELAEHLDDARDEIEQLRHENDSLSVPVTTAQGMSDRISRMLQLASDEASEIRANASAEVAEMVSVAQQEAQQLRDEAERDAAHARESANAEADSLRAEATQLVGDARTASEDGAREIADRQAAMETEHTNTMETARAEANRILDRARAEADALLTEAQADRDRTQEDFDVTLATRRDSAAAEIAEREATSQSSARELLESTAAESDRILERSRAIATERVMRSTALIESAQSLRTSMLAQLDEVRGHLDSLPHLLAELDGEKEHVHTETTELLNRALSDDSTITSDRNTALQS